MQDENILVRIGNSIKTARKKKGLSQEKLSEISGVDRSFLGKVERGEVNVSVITLCEIAKALGKNLKELI